MFKWTLFCFVPCPITLTFLCKLTYTVLRIVLESYVKRAALYLIGHSFLSRSSGVIIQTARSLVALEGRSLTRVDR